MKRVASKDLPTFIEKLVKRMWEARTQHQLSKRKHWIYLMDSYLLAVLIKRSNE